MIASAARLRRLLARRRCAICRTPVPRGVRYCPSHYVPEIRQHEEMNR